MEHLLFPGATGRRRRRCVYPGARGGWGGLQPSGFIKGPPLRRMLMKPSCSSRLAGGSRGVATGPHWVPVSASRLAFIPLMPLSSETPGRGSGVATFPRWAHFKNEGASAELAATLLAVRSHEVAEARSDLSAMRLNTTRPRERKQNIVTLRPDAGNTFDPLSDPVDVCSSKELVDMTSVHRRT